MGHNMSTLAHLSQDICLGKLFLALLPMATQYFFLVSFLKCIMTSDNRGRYLAK